MTTRMPRGAMPARRSDLAAAKPYRLQSDATVFVPSGAFPSPNQELAAADPYEPRSPAPESFLVLPTRIGSWEDQNSRDSAWAEEAFAKACAAPRIFISPDAVLEAMRECGSSNFSEFMQGRGFQVDGKAYRDGTFCSLDWTDEPVLNSAIANAGPVKIGVAVASLTSSSQDGVTPGRSGWAIYGVGSTNEPASYCASLCGYGALRALVELFERNGVDVLVPAGMPAETCYAMFVRSSVGIIDRRSLMEITGEAWVRNPTTVVRNQSHQT